MTASETPDLTLFEVPTRFENDICAFEAQDAQNPPPANVIVFAGSSSVRMWDDLAADFAPLPVLNRGFGGSYLSDSVFYAERIMTCYQPRAVVVYAGENDIGNGASGAQVFEQFQLLVEKVRAHCLGAEIFWVSIKPSPGRGEAIQQMRVANYLIRAWAQNTLQVINIDISTSMLDENGVGRAELFLEDGVHMKRSGYKLWKAVISPYLEKYVS